MHKLNYAAAFAVAVLAGTALNTSDANAFVCGAGPYRAGCISSRGAIGIGPRGVAAVGRYGNTYAWQRGSSCYWRNGYRICPQPYYW